MVGLGSRERSLGQAAIAKINSNIKNTAFELKRLIGRRFDEADLQVCFLWVQKCFFVVFLVFFKASRVTCVNAAYHTYACVILQLIAVRECRKTSRHFPSKWPKRQTAVFWSI